jgi:selenocysteine lyase/cysteine desulfurase
MGTGALVLSAHVPVRPVREGGAGFKSENPEQPEEYPWRLEAGTLNLPGIARLAAGVSFVRSVGVKATAEHASAGVRRLARPLRFGMHRRPSRPVAPAMNAGVQVGEPHGSSHGLKAHDPTRPRIQPI